MSSALTPQRGAVPIALDRPRILFFSAASTWLLVEMYGIHFLAELYTARLIEADGADEAGEIDAPESDAPKTAGKPKAELTLKSKDALCFFLWAGLQDEARETGETLTLEFVEANFIVPRLIVPIFNSLVLALSRTVSTPAEPGKSEAAAPAAKRAAKKTAAKRLSILKSRSGSRLAR